MNNLPEKSYSKLDLMQARVSSVPNDWELSCVGKVFGIKNNLRKPINQSERDKIQGCYPYYGPTKVQDYISTYEQDGDFVIIGEDGDHFLKFKERPMTQLVSGKCTVNNHAHIIQGTEKATRNWFYYYFMHRDIFSFLSRQGAGRFKLNKASLEKLPVLVPPLPEQTKIANTLSTWDNAIATTEQLLANSQQQKKALMQQLLTGKRRLRDENGEVFCGVWEVKKLKDVSTITMGTSPKSSAYNEQKKGLPLIQGNADIQDRKSSPRVYTSAITKKCNLNDILLSVRAPVGTISISLHHACIGRGISAIRANTANNQAFLYQWLLFFEPRWDMVSQGSTFESINSNDIKSLKITLPPLSEQQAIAQVLTTADEQIDSLKAQIERLQREKKGLMQVLLSGKVRVKV